MLQAYDWPGNVRQLQNVIRQIVVLNDASHVEPSMFPTPLKPLAQPQTKAQLQTKMQVEATKVDIDTLVQVASRELLSESTQEAHTHTADQQRIQPLWLTEKQTIEGAIALCDGNVPKAAALLDISPSTIYRKRMTWEEQAERSSS